MYSILTEYAIDLEIKAFFSSLVAFLSFKMLRPPFMSATFGLKQNTNQIIIKKNSVNLSFRS
jgi:hypothetical protein